MTLFVACGCFEPHDTRRHTEHVACSTSPFPILTYIYLHVTLTRLTLDIDQFQRSNRIAVVQNISFLRRSMMEEDLLCSHAHEKDEEQAGILSDTEICVTDSSVRLPIVSSAAQLL